MDKVKKKPSTEKRVPKKPTTSLSTKNVDNFRVELKPLQKPVVNFHRENEITILHAPAGTGKDFMQMFRAVNGLINKEFEQLIFMRSAVEVGVGLGFMPGDEKDKTAPYERLFYQQLSQMIDKGLLERLKGKIRFEHIGFIRGLTFSHSAVILSEAQNCTLHELITVCTRIASSSKLYINGDESQSDIKNGGFKNFLRIMEGIDGVGIMELGPEFQMRNQMIVEIDKRYRSFLENK